MSRKWVYYNDNDPFVCEWARNLVRAGLVPDGEVDCRSIVEVRPEDLRGFRQWHFFAGILGWPYALRLAGWPDDRPVLTGSCPCQPFSSAGQRRGDADERHLWPALFRIVAELKPATCFGEQVASRDGREWFAGVRADLETLGYACGAADLCAAGVGAPHIRQRIYWVADADGGNSGSKRKQPRRKYRKLAKDDGDTEGLPDAAGVPERAAESRHCPGKVEWGWPERSSPVGRFVDEHGVGYRVPEPFVPFVAHGVPGILDRISAGGNAIVPQVAEKFVRAFMECRP